MLVTKLKNFTIVLQHFLAIGDTWISSRVRSSPGRWKNPRGELIKHLCRWTSSMSGLISSWRPWPYPAWTFWVYRQITVFIVSSFDTGPPVQVSTERSMFLATIKVLSCCQYRRKRHRRERITLSDAAVGRSSQQFADLPCFRLVESLCLAWSCRCWRAASTPLRPPDDFSERSSSDNSAGVFVDASVE